MRQIKLEWTDGQMLDLWNWRCEAENHGMPWTEFVDTYYPGVSLTAVRDKYYEMRKNLQATETTRDSQAPSVAGGKKRAHSTSGTQDGQRKKFAGPQAAPQIPKKARAVNPQSPGVGPLSGHERDKASIRLARLTPQNWLYILEQAQACDVKTAKLKQLERELKNTARRLAETEVELMRSKSRSQAGDSSNSRSSSREFQEALQQVKTTALELHEALAGFETRSRDCMPNINWQTADTQKCVNTVKEKFKQHEKAIQAFGGHP